MRIGLSTLSVNPERKTGLLTMFSAFMADAVRLFPDVEFVVFTSSNGASVATPSDRITLRDGYAANDRVLARICTEYMALPVSARRAGCDVLMTNGLVPLFGRVPTAMHLLSLHHLSSSNRLGFARSAYRHWASHHGLRNADLIITNTRFACKQILELDASVAPKLLQSYEGIDHTLFHARADARERDVLQHKFGVRPPYFLWCSNFYPYKGAELLMEAWCDLPLDIRATVPLVMVGGAEWGDSRDRALGIAKARGSLDQVRMLGWVDDEYIPMLFRHAAVFVHPSREETFGRSVLEAMACGVPCVVQNIPVMEEVTDGHALMIDYRDRSLATASLLAALTDSGMRTRLIDGGLVRSKCFSFERLAAERIGAMRQLIGEPVGTHSTEYPPRYASSFV